MMDRPIVNITRLPARSGDEAFPVEVLLLGPEPDAPSGGYLARITVQPDGPPIDLRLDALLRALVPAIRPPAGVGPGSEGKTTGSRGRADRRTERAG